MRLGLFCYTGNYNHHLLGEVFEIVQYSDKTDELGNEILICVNRHDVIVYDDNGDIIDDAIFYMYKYQLIMID